MVQSWCSELVLGAGAQSWPSGEAASGETGSREEDRSPQPPTYSKSAPKGLPVLSEGIECDAFSPFLPEQIRVYNYTHFPSGK